MDHLRRAAYLLQETSKPTYHPRPYPPIKNHAFHNIVSNLWQLFQETVQFLEEKYNIRPVIIGGLALQHYGVVRMTEDIDLLISKNEYDRLKDEGKISFGSLKFKPGFQIDMIYGEMDRNPDPEVIRDGDSNYPTLEGLIYTKIIQDRAKDAADIVELIKANLGLSLKERTIYLLPTEYHKKFNKLWNQALKEVGAFDASC